MKKTIFYLLAIPLLGFSQAQNPEQRIESPIKAVTLYLDGAEVNQQKQVNLNAGITQVVFTNLSSKLIPKSIQVNVGENINVLSVSEKLNFLSLNAESAKIKQLRDSLKTNQYKTQQLAYDKEAYDKEKELLAKNNSIGGQEKGVSIAELKLAADFYRSRIKEINSEILKLDTKINEMYAVTNRLQNELNELNINENKPTGEIMVLLQSDTKVAANIDLKYVVSDAGWAPYYELKAEDIGKPITLVYRARAFNNTGINWADVKLKLSTSDPTRNASKPTVMPWFLNFNSDVYGQSNGYISNNANKSYYQKSQINDGNLENQFGAKQQLNEIELKSWNEYQVKNKRDEANNTKKIVYEEVQVSELSAEFEIKKPYSIPSDAKPYIVEVTTYSLNATFKHYSLPKVEKDAFLLARITGWEDLDLIEGPANVYFAGTFVGQSYVNPRSVNDTLDLSFGRDSKVIVTRTKIKDFNNEKVMGNNRKMTYSYEMIIKNNRKSAINIDLEDQKPLSQSNEIVVEVTELSKGQVNADDGKVSWKFLIPPGESQKVIYTYTIKYPKNRNVDTEKKMRKVRAAF
ncbi:MAG: mucoidy inhibitor MuiA family protein [Bacteroidota bacterium]|nr:mucoidy inhibitor MuiA family protein [Bacteroidota bacterium]